MAFRTWKEYLDNKGKTVEKPEIDPKADTGPEGDDAPEPFATSGKGWEDKAALKDKPAPYSAPGKDKGQQKYEKGLGDEGDSKNKVEYKPGDLDATKDRGDAGHTWPKCSCLKSEVVSKTIGLPINEFASFVRENQGEVPLPGVYAEQKGMVQPDPVQAVNYVAALAAYNDSILEHLVREVNRTGYLARLVASSFRHNEAYQVVGGLYNASQTFRKRLDRAVEATDVPMQDEEDPEETAPKKPDEAKGKKKPSGPTDPNGEQQPDPAADPNAQTPAQPGPQDAPPPGPGPQPGGQPQQPMMMRWK